MESCQKQAGAINSEHGMRQEGWEDSEEYCDSFPMRKWDGNTKVPAAAMWFKDPGGTVEFYKSEEDEQPRFRMVGYTGQAMPHPFFGKVIVNVAGVEMGKTKKGGKKGVLREHNPYRIVGYGYPARDQGSITLEDGVYSETTRDGREVRGLQAEGYPWECSINIDRATIVDLPRGESMEVNGRLHKGPAIVFTKSRLREISFCALGMDADTMSMAAANGEQVEIELEKDKEPEMSEENVAAEAPDVQKITAEAKEDGKKELVAHFDALFAEFGQDFAVEMFRAGKSLDEAKLLHYEKVKKELADLKAAAPVKTERAEAIPTGSAPDVEKPKSLKAAAESIMQERNAKGENLTLGQAMKLALKLGFEDRQ